MPETLSIVVRLKRFSPLTLRASARVVVAMCPASHRLQAASPG
jgi:hypothetical protein